MKNLKPLDYHAPILPVAAVGLLLGLYLGYALANQTIRNNAIQQACAYYDSKTGEFKWGAAQ